MTRLLIGMVIGAGLMYILDPERGQARRELIRDKAGGAARDAASTVATRARDLRGRVQGGGAQEANEAAPSTGESINPNEVITDDLLVSRVRAEMSRALQNAGAIHVFAENGTITLSGPIRNDEVNALIDRVKRVRGVKDVENHMSVYNRAAEADSAPTPRTGNA